MEETEVVILSRQQEKAIMNAMYDFVMRTTTAELGALPEMTKMLIDYWAEKY